MVQEDEGKNRDWLFVITDSISIHISISSHCYEYVDSLHRLEDYDGFRGILYKKCRAKLGLDYSDA